MGRSILLEKRRAPCPCFLSFFLLVRAAVKLPSFPCLAGYLKPAFEPTKPSRTAIVLLALRLESLSYRLNLPIGGGLIPLPFTVPCDLYTDTPIYPSLVKGESAERRESPLPVVVSN